MKIQGNLQLYRHFLQRQHSYDRKTAGIEYNIITGRGGIFNHPSLDILYYENIVSTNFDQY